MRQLVLDPNMEIFPRKTTTGVFFPFVLNETWSTRYLLLFSNYDSPNDVLFMETDLIFINYGKTLQIWLYHGYYLGHPTAVILNILKIFIAFIIRIHYLKIKLYLIFENEVVF